MLSPALPHLGLLLMLMSLGLLIGGVSLTLASAEASIMKGRVVGRALVPEGQEFILAFSYLPTWSKPETLPSFYSLSSY